MIRTGKKHRKADRKRHLGRMDRQRKASKEKIDSLKQGKLKVSKKSHIPASYLWQQYESPRCWKTAAQARKEFGRLNSKSARMRFVREQILMRRIGLGWEGAYHPWSKNDYTFSPEELLEHLVNTVIPLQDTEVVPRRPPINLPTRVRPYKLGTQSKDSERLDNSRLNDEDQLRLEAMSERESLEASGFGDQLYEMNEVSWPWEKIKKGFKIDKLFVRSHDGVDCPMWAQGVVQSLLSKNVSDESSFIKVTVKWNDDCVRDGEAKVTREKLLRSKWNCETHKLGVWRRRENLHHLAVDARDLVNPN
jgi:hypothetical protein